jgi:hypothetical protein
MIKGSDQITVIADDCENRHQVIKFLSDMKNVPVVVKHLVAADCVFGHIELYALSPTLKSLSHHFRQLTFCIK